MRTISLLTLAVLLTVLAIYVWRARANSSANRWFAVLTFEVACWVLGIGGVESGTNTELWGRITFASASMMPATFLAFSFAFPAPSPRPSTSLRSSMLLIGITLAVLSITTGLIAHDISKTPAGAIQRTSGRLFPVFTVYFLGCLLIALGVFVDKWRKARGLARAQLQYLGIGLVVLISGGVTTNLVIPILTGRSTYSWLGPYFTLPFVALVGHAIIRHRLMDLRVFINRGLAYALAITVTSAVIITLGRLVIPNFDDTSFPVGLDLTIITIVAVVMLSSPSQKFFSRLIDPYLYRGRLEYAVALSEATRRLSRLMQPRELSAELRQVFNDAFVPESFALLIRAFEGQATELLSEGARAAADLLTLAALMTGQPKPSVIIVNPAREAGATRAAHEALRTSGIEIIVTLGRRGQPLGAILLGPRRSGDPYFQSDLALIESVADLASIALENALLYRQRIQVLEYSERLLESLDSAVVAIDVAGRITSLNPAAKSLLGLDDHHRGALLDVLPSEVAWALAMAVTQSWRPREVEATIDHKSHAVHVILSTAVLHDDEQSVAGALVVVTDLSTVKELERKQRRMEHFAIMARFYAGIAHEIRNPLAAISNLIAMLPDRFDDPEYRDTAVRLLPIEVARIVRLADRLRHMAPSEDGKMNPVSLLPLLDDIVAIHSPAAQDQRVKIQLQCAEELPRILGDPAQLVQLFVNLLRNAIEAMPNGGTVTIEAENLRESNSIIVRVLDEGPGIDPAVRSKIFEPFFTTKPYGTGLGLSICREIANFHRARLALLPRSSLGGSVAEVEFPCLVPVLAHA